MANVNHNRIDIGNGVLEKWVDMGDGTHAVVRASIAVGTDGSPGDPLTAGTNRSGSITTGGTAQQLAAANTARRSLTGQNISIDSLWINEVGGTAAADTAGSFEVEPGDTFEISTNRAISIVGATTGQAWTAVEV
jgi:hypothetical protein